MNAIKSRNEYVDFKSLNNDFQFLEVNRYDPKKKALKREKLILLKYMKITIMLTLQTKPIDVLTVAIPIVNGNVQYITTYPIG
ncbi:MAG: hypothetical protein CM15mP127_01660 [Gammaproteobacteria bacterium]|nr:MAG: hypothetical protein CM15mP127_01660 [Gammaproteobacteria bacterium]